MCCWNDLFDNFSCFFFGFKNDLFFFHLFNFKTKTHTQREKNTQSAEVKNAKIKLITPHSGLSTARKIHVMENENRKKKISNLFVSSSLKKYGLRLMFYRS